MRHLAHERLAIGLLHGGLNGLGRLGGRITVVAAPFPCDIAHLVPMLRADPRRREARVLEVIGNPTPIVVSRSGEPGTNRTLSGVLRGHGGHKGHKGHKGQGNNGKGLA